MVIPFQQHNIELNECIEDINGNASKPCFSKMHNVQETQKTVSKQTDNRVADTSIFAILVNFELKFGTSY